MLPSPSLGPPLLSASWSPPLCCGMGFAVCAWVAGCVVVAGLGPEECAAVAVPQPAARAVRSAAPAAHRPRVNDMACPSDSQVFGGEPPRQRLSCPLLPGRLPPDRGGFAGGCGGCAGGPMMLAHAGEASCWLRHEVSALCDSASCPVGAGCVQVPCIGDDAPAAFLA